jgi:putative ABC transport system ATP-binding protein
MVLSVLRRMAGDGCAVAIATHSKQVEGSCDSMLDLGVAVS